MGFLSFLGGSYKPKDFVGKTIDQIFKDMKLDKMDKSIKEHEEYAGLSEEIKGAIDLLLDLKDGKTIIYEKCYKGKRAGVAGPAPAAAAVHHVARPASARPVARPISARPASAPKPAPPAAPVAEKADEDKEEGQSGGGKRRRKSRKSKKSKRRSHKKRKTSRR
jgi:hypothetical protein